MAPAHGTLSVLGEAGKDLVVISSYIVTYGYHCAVNECYTRTLAEGIEFHEQHHLKEHSWHEFNEAVIGNRVGKILGSSVKCVDAFRTALTEYPK